MFCIAAAVIGLLITVDTASQPSREHEMISARVDNPREAIRDRDPLASIEPIRSAAGFNHPGIFVGLDQLATSKERVLAGEAPWSTAFEAMQRSVLAKRGAPDFLAFAPADAPIEAMSEHTSSRCSATDPLGCVTYCDAGGDPDIGCSQMELDGRAVYTQALLWYFTGDRDYAKSAISILNAYAAQFRGSVGSNGPLITAWVAEVMLRGAELIRYTYQPDPGEPVFDVDRFSDMLRSAFVQTLLMFNWYTVPGNWMGSGADALMSAAVFLDDRVLYERAVALWRDYVPNYIYLKSDGKYPNYLHDAPVHNIGYVGTGSASSRANLDCLWLDNKAAACRSSPKSDPGDIVYQNGQTMETCRDIGHASLGLAAALGAAETAFLQGDNLYAEQSDRLIAGTLYNAQIKMAYASHPWPTENAYPLGFCDDVPGLVRTGLSVSNSHVPVAYNAYAVREGIDIRPLDIPGYDSDYPDDDPLRAYVSERLSDGDLATDHIDVWSVLTHHMTGG